MSRISQLVVSRVRYNRSPDSPPTATRTAQPETLLRARPVYEMEPMHFIFGTCVPSQSSPCTLAPLTVLTRATCASRRSLLPPMLILLHALNRTANPQRFGVTARRPPAPREAVERHSGVASACGLGCAARRRRGECGVVVWCGFGRHSLRLYLANVELCRCSVLACPSDSDIVLRRVDSVRAGTVRIRTVYGACSSLKNAALTR